MLNRRSESVKMLWIHRVFHMICILTIWSFFYYAIAVKEGKETFNICHFLSQLYESNWNFSYWYLYAYLSFLISLPLLQRIAQNLHDKEYIYILVVYIIFNMFIPSAQYLLFQGRHSLNANISIEWFASNIVVFPFVGYLLTCRLRGFWNVKKILILWGINIGAIS